MALWLIPSQAPNHQSKHFELKQREAIRVIYPELLDAYCYELERNTKRIEGWG